jgi:hypothetical protein
MYYNAHHGRDSALRGREDAYGFVLRMKNQGSGRRLSRLIVDMYQKHSFLAQVTSDYIKGASISFHELPRRRVFSEIVPLCVCFRRTLVASLAFSAVSG